MTSAAAPAKIKGTSITAPTTTGDNHGLVLGQLKETTEIAQRLRGDPMDSFVRVSELLNATGSRLVNGTIQPPSPASATAGTVTVANSVTGNGSSTTPLQLVGDSASPGNNMVYGTNGSGVKSWYAAASGGSSPLTTKGDIFGHSTVDARIAVGSNGKVLTADSTAATGVSWQPGSALAIGVPATVPDLVYWLEADVLAANMSAGAATPTLPNFIPYWAGDYFIRGGSTAAKKSAGTLNSLGVLDFAGGEHYIVPAASIPYAAPGGFLLTEVTAFLVFKGTNFTGSANGYAAFSGGNGAGGVEFRITPAGALSYNDGSTVITGTAGVVANATWYQVNGKYSSATGAWAFRAARAAAGSGTTALAITKGSNALLFYNVNAGFNLDFVGSVAELIIYDRPLTPTEITTIENYLLAKWGV